MHVVANRGLFLAFTVEAPRRDPLTQRQTLRLFLRFGYCELSWTFDPSAACACGVCKFCKLEMFCDLKI